MLESIFTVEEQSMFLVPMTTVEFREVGSIPFLRDILRYSWRVLFSEMDDMSLSDVIFVCAVVSL